MLILSLVFVTVVLLLGFSLMKDTGKNTVHARRNASGRAQANGRTAAKPAIVMSKVVQN